MPSRAHATVWLVLGLVVPAAGCAGSDGKDNGGDRIDAAPSDSGDAAETGVADAGGRDDGGADAPPDASESAIVAVTFNTGSGLEMNHDADGDDYGRAEAITSDTWYGNGLAWTRYVAETRAFFDSVDADIVGFQEIFWAGNCPAVPDDARQGFICEGWSSGDPTVAQLVLGEGWQVACHPGKPDKCAAVATEFGRFVGCEADFCLEGLDGFAVDGCGRGARVARGIVETRDGERITVVNVHGSSGFSDDDRACRIAQANQVFVDLGDGAPAANGEVNVILGDLNTDPGRLADGDASAARWRELVDEERFHFVTDTGPDAPPTYAGLFNIDHVISDALDGSCWAAGVSPGHPPVLGDAVFFDHRPIVCELFPRNIR